jgi:hypothetical protein
METNGNDSRFPGQWLSRARGSNGIRRFATESLTVSVLFFRVVVATAFKSSCRHGLCRVRGHPRFVPDPGPWARVASVRAAPCRIGATAGRGDVSEPCATVRLQSSGTREKPCLTMVPGRPRLESSGLGELAKPDGRATDLARSAGRRSMQEETDENTHP